MKIIAVYSDQPQSGKSTFMNFDCNLPVVSVSFASPVKQTLSGFLYELDINMDRQLDYLYGDKKGEKIPELGVTAGYLMSTFATDYMREMINPDVWLDIAKKKVKEFDVAFHGNVIITIDDLRFPNEWEWIKSEGGQIVKIIRNGVRHDRSPKSEGQLVGYNPDFRIFNNRTLDEYKMDCQEVIERIFQKWGLK